jgi:hypothetical protein
MTRRVARSTRLVLLAALLGAAPARAASARSLHLAEVSDPTAVVELGGIWLFQAGDDPAFAHPVLDDSGWEQRLVPAARTSWPQRWRGHGWYRLHVGVEPAALGADWMVSLGRAREAVEVYWNGARVGQRGRFGGRPQGGERSTPLLAFVPASLVRSGDNVLAVRVYDPTYAGGLVAGPLLLGPPASVARRTEAERVLWPSAHLALAALTLVIGLGRLALAREAWGRREGAWLALAGLGLAVAHLGETALLAAVSPAVELAPRLPLMGAMTAALGLAGFFAARHDDPRAARVVWGRAGFLAAIAALLLAPDAVAHWVAAPAVFLAALVGTLYAAWLLARAARRQEGGALPVFACLVAFALLLVFDGIAGSEAALVPSTSLIGAVGVFLVSSFAGAVPVAEHPRAFASPVAELEERLDGARTGLLDAAALSITDRERFLDAVVQEVVRAMAVRRCSLLLDGGDALVVAAAVGLPRHARAVRVPKTGSIAGWVFTRRSALSDTRVPEELARVPASGAYATRAFLSQPVLDGGRCIGVLNVSDRLDGGPFAARDEQAMADIARKLVAVLTRLGGI